jgi:hypothetical protein
MHWSNLISFYGRYTWSKALNASDAFVTPGLLLVGEPKVDLRSSLASGLLQKLRHLDRRTYAKFGVHKACDTFLLVDLVERLEIRRVQRNDLEVLGNSGGSNRFGQWCDTTGDWERSISAWNLRMTTKR